MSCDVMLYDIIIIVGGVDVETAMQQQTMDEVADIVSQMAFKVHVYVMYSAIFCDGGGGGGGGAK